MNIHRDSTDSSPMHVLAKLMEGTKFSALALAFISIFVFAAPATAQTRTNDAASSDQESDLIDAEFEIPLLLEDIIVTVRRFEEYEGSVPLTIRVIREEKIIRDGIVDIEDVARLVAGVTYDIGGFPNDTRPGVRGMQTERGRPSVAVMVDGLDLSGENMAISGGGAGVVSDLLDLERIEIVKGPQTTLYGRGAFAGAINYISKKPSERFEGRLILEGAEYGQRRGVGMISGPIVDDVLGYRINVALRESDGFWTNPVNGGPLGAESFQGFAGSLRFTPGDNWDINLRYRNSNTDNSDTPTAQLQANTRVPVPDGTFTAGPPGSPSLPCPSDFSGLPPQVVTACTRGVFIGRVSADIDDVQMGFNEETGLPPSGLDLDQELLTLDSLWYTDYGTWRYKFGWIDNDTYVEADGDFTNYPAPPGFVFSLSALQQLTYQDERFDHTLFWTQTAGDFDLMLGAQYLTEDSVLINGSKFWLRNPNSPLGGPPFFLATQQNPLDFPARITRDTDYRAAFGTVKWHITDSVRLGVEARYNSDEVSYVIPGWRLQDVSLSGLTPVCLPGIEQGATFMGVPGPNVPPPGTVQACPRQDSVSYDEWTPRVTLDWQVNPNLMVYANAARGFKPGGFNVNETTSFDEQGYLPEFLDAYEIGFKSVWNRLNLAVDGAVFFNDYTDQQIGIQRTQTGSADTVLAVSGITNAASVESVGFELATRWVPTDRISMDLNYAYTDATFENFVAGPAITAGPGSFEACGVPDGQVSSPQFRAEAGNACGDFSGNAVAKSPKHAVNLGALYRAPLGSTGNSWFVELNAQYRSKRYLSESNLNFVPSYTNFDLQAGVDFDQFSVIGFITNLTDDDSIRVGQRNVDPGNPEGFAPGRAIIAYLPEPRVAGVRFIYRFGNL